MTKDKQEHKKDDQRVKTIISILGGSFVGNAFFLSLASLFSSSPVRV
jgi:hypothetical protein